MIAFDAGKNSSTLFTLTDSDMRILAVVIANVVPGTISLIRVGANCEAIAVTVRVAPWSAEAVISWQSACLHIISA